MEGSVAWAKTDDFKYLDCQIDVGPNILETLDQNLCGPVRESRAEAGIHLGLHTLISPTDARHARVYAVKFLRGLAVKVEMGPMRLSTTTPAAASGGGPTSTGCAAGTRP